MDLRQKITLGQAAQSAYNNYFRYILDDVKNSLLKEFEDLSFDDPRKDIDKQLYDLKAQLDLWNKLRDRIQSDINTGKIAAQQLEEELK